MVSGSLKAEIAESRKCAPIMRLIALALSLVFLLLTLMMGPVPALAGERIRRPVLPNSDATLYEVTETVRFDTSAGQRGVPSRAEPMREAMASRIVTLKRTPIRVRSHERDLGFPLVRLEVTFGQ